MQIDLTGHETDYLRMLLETARKELLHELHHAAKQDFKDGLKKQLDVNEKLLKKVEPVFERA